MNKMLVAVVLILMVGCDDSGQKQTATDQELGQTTHLQNACAEIMETRRSESSERMEILKSYEIEPRHARTVELGLEIMAYLNQEINKALKNIESKPDNSLRLEQCAETFDLMDFHCVTMLQEVKSDTSRQEINNRFEAFKGCYEMYVNG